MKKSIKNFLKFLFISPLPLVSLTQVNAEVKNDTKPKEPKNIETWNLFQEQYEKMSMWNDINAIWKGKLKVYSYNPKAHSVGVIEVNSYDFFNKFLANSRVETPWANNIKITNPNYYSNHSMTKHGAVVSSVIGTEFGINKNAKIYYSNWNGDEYNELEEIIKNMVDNNVSVINLSYANSSPLYSQEIKRKLYYPAHAFFETYGFKDKLLEIGYFLDIIHLNYFDIDTLKNSYVNKDKFNVWDIYKNSMHSLKKEYSIYNKYILENDIKIIKGAGNYLEYFYEFTQNVEPLFFNKLPENITSLSSNYFRNKLNEYINVVEDLLKQLKKVTPTGGSITSSNRNEYNLLSQYAQPLLEYLKSNAKIKLEYALHDSQSVFNKKSDTQSKINDMKAKLYELIDMESPFVDNVITVGSLNINKKPSDFSLYDSLDANKIPFVSSFGNGYESDRSIAIPNRNKYFLNSETAWHFSPEDLNYYKTFGGTSLSTPMITGMISLLQTRLDEPIPLTALQTLMAHYAYTSSGKELKNNDTLKNEFNNVDPRQKNKAKNKSGYGVPIYSKILKQYKNYKQKQKQLNNERVGLFKLQNVDLSKFLDYKEDVVLIKDFRVEPSEKLKMFTASSKVYSVQKVVDRISTIITNNEPINRRNIVEDIQNAFKDDSDIYNKNIFDIRLELKLYKNENDFLNKNGIYDTRKFKSDSLDSSTEKIFLVDVSKTHVNAVDVFMSFPQLKYMLYKLRSYMNSKSWASDVYINQVLKEFVSAYEKIINNELEIYCLNETNI
ncbi:S8 family serine peptidase [Mycoplasma nasistruthionis]|uniref:Peptidase S8/S53 domain-containing protein n=1 Tax=Mycoplasma nasistruthionis TaxID=353852 RepID=A0A4Y6I713_9MOLU|nr:S8 family serine peptidase [Mycoplasma nasistruthionis]QDF65182.1 hypothetical protein FIV53_02700 [Mycoplasma nasistruthionis]